MPYIADLERCGYLEDRFTDGDTPAPCVFVAVGWLHDRLPAAPGEPDDLKPIARKLVACWHAAPDLLGHEMGRHGCGLCGRPPSRAPATLVTLDGVELALGEGYIAVPADSAVFVCPSLVIHYILEHCYRPPSCFREALALCPEPGSRAFAAALRRAGPWSWRYADIWGAPAALWRRLAFNRIAWWEPPKTSWEARWRTFLARHQRRLTTVGAESGTSGVAGVAAAIERLGLAGAPPPRPI